MSMICIYSRQVLEHIILLVFIQQITTWNYKNSLLTVFDLTLIPNPLETIFKLTFTKPAVKTLNVLNIIKCIELVIAGNRTRFANLCDFQEVWPIPYLHFLHPDKLPIDVYRVYILYKHFQLFTKMSHSILSPDVNCKMYIFHMCLLALFYLFSVRCVWNFWILFFFLSKCLLSVGVSILFNFMKK